MKDSSTTREYIIERKSQVIHVSFSINFAQAISVSINSSLIVLYYLTQENVKP